MWKWNSGNRIRDADINYQKVKFYILGNSPVKFVNKSNARHTVSFHLSVNRQCLTLEFRKKNEILSCYTVCLTIVSAGTKSSAKYMSVQEKRNRYEELVRKCASG